MPACHMPACCTARSSDGAWDVFITGHSLGGALATLCAYELAGRK
jgi:putative lipase involved disintegration of autophagic bodies